MLLKETLLSVRWHVEEERVACRAILAQKGNELAFQFGTHHVLVIALNLVDAISEEKEMVVRVLVIGVLPKHMDVPVFEAWTLRYALIPYRKRSVLGDKVFSHRREPTAPDLAFKKRIDAVGIAVHACTDDGDGIAINDINALFRP